MTSFGQEILPFRTPPNRGDLLASVATQRFFDPVHSKEHSAIPVVRGVSSGAINEVGSRALCIETPRTNVHPAACYLRYQGTLTLAFCIVDVEDSAKLSSMSQDPQALLREVCTHSIIEK